MGTCQKKSGVNGFLPGKSGVFENRKRMEWMFVFKKSVHTVCGSHDVSQGGVGLRYAWCQQKRKGERLGDSVFCG